MSVVREIPSPILMAVPENIYDSLEPFTKYPILISRADPGSDSKFNLRPVCLRTDLQIIYDWQNNISGFSNFHTNRHQPGALFFHKKILESVNGQSLLILKDDKAAALWAITPAQFDPYLQIHQPGVQDKTLEFLMKEPNEHIFSESLAICLQYLGRAPSPGRLFICINDGSADITPILFRSGFVKSDTGTNIYSATYSNDF
jgi:hypothetical protein